jgi:FkbM family methyltransferase
VLGKVKFSVTPENANGMYNVLDGEYTAFNVGFPPKPRVLDIGGNVGAFAIWAAHYWPDSTITAYEPDPDCCATFRKNITDNDLDSRVQLIYGAVTTAPYKTIPLYRGINNNTGMNSLYRTESTINNFIEVPTVHPAELPPCEVMKIDTEGSEIDILRSMTQRPPCIML